MEEEKIVKKEEKISKEEYLKLKRSNSKKTAVIIVLVFTMVLMMLLLVIYFCNGNKDDKPVDNGGNKEQEVNKPVDNGNNGQENNNNTIVNDEPKYENSLTTDESGTYGTIYVEGYAKVTQEADCGSDICQGDEPKHDVVSFYVTSPKIAGTDDWFVTDQNGENGYIQLGCLENGVVSFTAFADEFYEKRNDNINSTENYYRTIALSKDDSDKIISSSETNLITLKIENKKWTHGGDGYTCSSRITGAEVIK